jgi:hypothetical protein
MDRDKVQCISSDLRDSLYILHSTFNANHSTQQSQSHSWLHDVNIATCGGLFLWPCTHDVKVARIFVPLESKEPTKDPNKLQNILYGLIVYVLTSCSVPLTPHPIRFTK